MNKHLKEFLKRGMLFGGFGPIIAGVVFLILDFTVSDFSLSGAEALLAIISTYILAFVQAGASIFNQIEHWPVAKSTAFHLGSIYLAYVGCYLVNSWIPFEPLVILVFTAVFIATYFIIWLTVYFITRAISRKMSVNLK